MQSNKGKKIYEESIFMKFLFEEEWNESSKVICNIFFNKYVAILANKKKLS